MQRVLFTLTAAIAGAVFVAPHVAFAADDAKPTEYVVKAGETCSTIAATAFGDIKRVDLVHLLNTSLGPVPHILHAGQILLLPPKPTPAPLAPDATLTRIRNVVEVRTPEPRPGKPNDPLFRGNRVGTKESSAADLTFRDETQVKLGENTLVVIFGDTQARAARTNAADATLVSGHLRASLSSIAGKKPDKPRFDTSSGAVVINDGEAQISVDDKQATRLAVYRGGSTVTAQRRTVPVDDGFGSKAEVGRVPTPPKPLPAAPVWTVPPAALVLTGGAQGDVSGTYAAGQGPGDAPAEWHVQIARDTNFDTVVVDVRVPVAVVALQAQKVPPGTYATRVSAIDGDHFEGKWSAPASFAVSRLAVLDKPRHRARIETEDKSLTCTVDGGAHELFPIELGRSSRHSLTCTRAGSTATFAIDALPLTQVRATADMLWRSDHAGALRVRLTDENDEPLDRIDVFADAPKANVEIGRFHRFASEGVYIAPISWKPGAGTPRFTLRVAGAFVAETNAVALDPAVAVESKRKARAELSLGGGASVRAAAQLGFSGFVGLGLAVPLGRGDVSLELRGFGDRYPVASVDVELQGIKRESRIGVTLLGASLPLGYRFGLETATVVPYIVAGPQLARQSVDDDATGTRATALALGVYAAVGVGLRAGPGAVFLEGGFRGATLLGKDTSSVSSSALGLALGYRLRP